MELAAFRGQMPARSDSAAWFRSYHERGPGDSSGAVERIERDGASVLIGSVSCT